MMKAVVLMDHRQSLSERFRVELKVFEVNLCKKYPEGIKARFVLIDVIRKIPRLLIDNHPPFGFHVHDGLPENYENRRILKTMNYEIALDEFWRLTREIMYYEN